MLNITNMDFFRIIGMVCPVSLRSRGSTCEANYCVRKYLSIVKAIISTKRFSDCRSFVIVLPISTLIYDLGFTNNAANK